MFPAVTVYSPWLLGAAIWIAGAVQGFSQASEDWLSHLNQPQPPATMVWDRDNLFTRQPELTERLSRKLQSLRHDIGFDLYLVIQSGLDSTGADTTAALLQHQWGPEQNSMVVVYETDSKTLGIGRPFVDDPEFDGIIPSLEMEEIVSQAVKAVDPGTAHEELLEILIDQLSEGFRSCVKHQAGPPSAGRSLRLGLFALGAGSILALGALIVGWLVVRGERDLSRRFWFTEIDRPERLGAPFGGGLVTTHRFKN